MAQALPFIAAAGSLVQGVGGLMAGNANAKRALMERDDELQSTAGEIRRMRDQQRAQIGEQLAAQVSGGFEGGTGTALDVMELRRQGNLRARALEMQAKDAKREGRFALVSGILGAGSSAIKARSDWAQERRAGA
jgi:hypothetical protein